MNAEEDRNSRPLPEVTPLTAPFWAAARAHRLAVQRCVDCGTYRFPPEPCCFECASDRLEWAPVSGYATLYSWTVAHPPLLPYFAARAPVLIAAVELHEGPRMVTRLADVRPEDCRFGLELRVDFEDIDDLIALPVFRLRGAVGGSES